MAVRFLARAAGNCSSPAHSENEWETGWENRNCHWHCRFPDQVGIRALRSRVARFSTLGGKIHTMKTNQTAPENIDEYIRGFPKEIRESLQKVRMTIRGGAASCGSIKKPIRAVWQNPFWCILPPSKSTSDFSPRHQESGRSSRSSQPITAQQVPCSFLLTDPFRLA